MKYLWSVCYSQKIYTDISAISATYSNSGDLCIWISVFFSLIIMHQYTSSVQQQMQVFQFSRHQTWCEIIFVFFLRFPNLMKSTLTPSHQRVNIPNIHWSDKNYCQNLRSTTLVGKGLWWWGTRHLFGKLSKPLTTSGSKRNTRGKWI